MASSCLVDKAFSSVCRGLGQQLGDKDFCDITVTVREREFSCHRAVLVSVSEFFKTSLKPCWQDASNSRVGISHEDVSPESFGYLMDILYRGEDKVSNQTAKGILRMSVYLQIKFLEDYCIKFLEENLQPKDCLETWQFAQKYDLDTLAEKSFKMAVDEIGGVWQEDELLALPKSMLLIVLSEQKKLNMDDVCRTILRWVEADQDARKIHLEELLPFMCFPLLNSDYLCDLVAYLNHPFRKILFEKINEGLTYNIKGQQKNDELVIRKILARQSVSKIPDLKSCVIMIGGYIEFDKPIRETYAFDVSFVARYSLATMPEDTGLDFASCTWYNEVYVSGGSQLPTFFAVYKPGDNEWEVLPSLPHEGREQHAMAAISSFIYVLGGRQKTADGEKTVSSNVLRYNTKTKEWSVFCQLTLGVRVTTAATLGHRIYLFGGVDSNGANTDLVQCVDTLGGCTYQAGRLPSPTCGARALSNGGRIYVVRPEGDVISMWESFLLAEHIEKTMSTKNEKENDPLPTIRNTVSFREVGKFPGCRHFGACLSAGDITVFGGQSKDGELLQSFHTIRLENGTATQKSLQLIPEAAKFDLHMLNIPQIFLNKVTVAKNYRRPITMMRK